MNINILFFIITYLILTNTNIIYQDNKFYFIDWEMTRVIKKNICGIWYIFADIIDFLNVFFIMFGTNLPLFYNISKAEFDSYYNIIKNQETIIDENNLSQCHQAFNDNIQILSQFVAFVKRRTGIDYSNLFRRGGKKIKRKTKQKSKKSKRKSKKTKIKTKNNY